MRQPDIELIARGILRSGSHVLLCINRKHGYSFLPGGHIDFGEHAAAALAREFQEEAGLRVRVGDLIGVSENSFLVKRNGKPDKPHHEVNLVFHVEQLGRRKPEITPPEIRSIEPHIGFLWQEASQLASLDFRPVEMVSLVASFANNPIPLIRPRRWHSIPMG